CEWRKERDLVAGPNGMIQRDLLQVHGCEWSLRYRRATGERADGRYYVSDGSDSTGCELELIAPEQLCVAGEESNSNRRRFRTNDHSTDYARESGRRARGMKYEKGRDEIGIVAPHRLLRFDGERRSVNPPRARRLRREPYCHRDLPPPERVTPCWA